VSSYLTGRKVRAFANFVHCKWYKIERPTEIYASGTLMLALLIVNKIDSKVAGNACRG